MPEVSKYVGNRGATNSTTEVLLVGQPNSGESFIVRSFELYNRDTVAATFELYVKRSGVNYRQCRITLDPGDTFELGEDGETIVLTTSDTGLYVVLAGAVITNQLEWNVSWFQYDATISGNVGNLNSTTEVELVASPTVSGDSGNARVVRNVFVYNRDTVAVTLQISSKRSGTLRRAANLSLDVGDTFLFGENTGTIILQEGDSLVAALAGAVATNQPQYHVNWREEPQAVPA